MSAHLPKMRMTMMLMMAWKPMKMSARFHASVRFEFAPKKMATQQMTRKTASAPLFFVMNLKLLSA